MGSAIQRYIDESFRKVLDEMKAREDEHWKGLIETLGRSFISISETQAQTLTDIASLKQDVRSLHTDGRYLQDIVTAHISTVIPAPSPSDSPREHLSSSSHHSPAPTEPLESPGSPSITLSLALDTQPPTISSTTESLPTDSSFVFSPPISTPVQTIHLTPVAITDQPIPESTPVLPLTPESTVQSILVSTPALHLTPISTFSQSSSPVLSSDLTPILLPSPDSPHSPTTDYTSIFYPESPPTLQLFPESSTLSADDKKGEKDP